MDKNIKDPQYSPLDYVKVECKSDKYSKWLKEERVPLE